MVWPTFKTQDEIPEAFRGVYEERDGEFQVKEPEATELRDTLSKVRKEAKELETRVKAAEAERDEVKREIDALKIKSGDDVDKKVAEALERWKKDTESQVAVEREAREKVEAKLRTLQLDDRAKKAFIDAGGRPEKADAAIRLNHERLDLVDDRLVVKDEKGEVSSVTIDKYFTEFAKEMPEFYKGSQGDGSGTSGVKDGGGAVGTVSFEDLQKLPPSEKMKWAREHQRA